MTPFKLLPVVALLAMQGQAQSAERRPPSQHQGETTTVRVGGSDRTFVRNDADAAPWKDSLSTPDTLFKESTLARFVDDDNEGPLNAPASVHPMAMVMENGDTYFVASGAITGYAGRINDVKLKYYYVAHDLYRWNPNLPANHVVTTLRGTHRCQITATDTDNVYMTPASHCSAPALKVLTATNQFYTLPDTNSFSSANPGYGLYYRRIFTIDDEITVGSGSSAFALRWGIHWAVRVGCINSTYGPCEQWASAYDGTNERGVAAAWSFAVIPGYSPSGNNFDAGLVPGFEGQLGIGRNLDVLGSRLSTGFGGSINEAVEIAPGGKVEIINIDFGDRLRVALAMGRYEDDPTTTAAFLIDRFKPTAPFSFSKSIDAAARAGFDGLASGATSFYIAPTLGASIAIDATDVTAPYGYSNVSTFGGAGGVAYIDINGASNTYNFPSAPKPRYFLEDLRLKAGQSE